LPCPTANRSHAKTKSEKTHRRGADRRWSGKVKTVSTFPPEGTFSRDAESVARIMASKKVSPKGIGSGIRMIQFFINRAGKNLSANRRRELETAKRILQDKRRKKAAGRR
jgi:tRNA(adenine34) deaminase